MAPLSLDRTARQRHTGGRMEERGDQLRSRLRANIERLDRRAVSLDGRRHAAVAVVVVDRPFEPGVLLTRRATALRDHPGQWAFPGGRIEEGETVVAAALRELREEL